MLFVAAALTIGNARAASSPQSATQDFLDWHARPLAGTFSSKENAQQLRKLMTSELLCLLRATDRYRARHVEAAPEDKPPYADGDMFLSSAWEPPQSAEIEFVRTHGAHANVLVRFVDSYGTSWRDRLQLRAEDGDWKVADIDWLGRFQDANGKVRQETTGSLVESLYKEMDRNQPLVHWHRQEVGACKLHR